MLKIFATTVLSCCGFVCSVCDACNCGNCDCGCPCGPAAAAAPATARVSTQARAGQAYRTYSYQPAYQPAPTYSRPSSGAPSGAFRDAGWKVRGGF